MRVTVSVRRETLEAFQHYSDAGSVSVSRAMGDWLDQQVPAVTYAAIGLEQAREEALAVPRSIAREVPGLHAVRTSGGPAAAAGGAPEAPRRAPKPPRPVIRGGKSPERGAK